MFVPHVMNCLLIPNSCASSSFSALEHLGLTSHKIKNLQCVRHPSKGSRDLHPLYQMPHFTQHLSSDCDTFFERRSTIFLPAHSLQHLSLIHISEPTRL